jgi:prolipoprotein diacylglyceryltransferase
VGSKLLALLDHPAEALERIRSLTVLVGGKSIVGGLLGGLVAVELAKPRLGLRASTGDLYALPLCLAIAIGRVGCFLTGLEDQTHGVATALPWGVDFGDGVVRHPTQLYEIGVLALLAAVLVRRRAALHRPGDVFRLFMVSYLGWRLGVEFIKPEHPLWLGLTAIQLACVAGLVYYARDLPRLVGLQGRAPSWQTG